MKRSTSALLLAACLVLLSIRPAAAQAEGPTYIVQAGDTLYSIAARFGTTVEALAEANSIADPSRLLPGTELLIPGFPGVTGTLQTQEIRFGETLESLSWQLGLDPAGLGRLNRVTNPQRVYAGEDFILPVGEPSRRAIPEGRVRLAGRLEGPLQTAMRSETSPWANASLLGDSYRAWFLPDEPIIHPEPGMPLDALPAPLSGLEILPIPLVQGGTSEVRIDHGQPQDLAGQLGDWKLDFHAGPDGTPVALQGIHAFAEPGLVELDLSVTADPENEGRARFRQPVLLRQAGFRRDPVLAVPAETIDPAFTAPEDAMIRAIVTKVSPDRLWEGPFSVPSSGYVTSPFGSRRNYNNTGYNYYHTGVDFSGRTGAPILAPAPGRVVFTGLLEVRGNTTFVDHGWGIYTGYLHQSQILVKVGDVVTAGQTIGLVGGTGRVTGPHLHWELWVNGVPVDPLGWVEASYP